MCQLINDDKCTDREEEVNIIIVIIIIIITIIIIIMSGVSDCDRPPVRDQLCRQCQGVILIIILIIILLIIIENIIKLFLWEQRFFWI